MLFALVAEVAGAQQLPNYALFDGKGRKVSHAGFLRALGDADVVLFGELHNNPIAHWLQLEVAKHLADRGPLVFGAEMIEADDQAALDRYLKGEIEQVAFDTLAWLWPNHGTDYAPLVDLAKERGLPFIATNVPRRYARAVSRGGFEALDTVPMDQRSFYAPMPIAFDPALPQYVKMLTMMGDHGTPDMVKAQALKDATMAHFILKHLPASGHFLHLNGSYHSDFREGICWYLLGARPGLKVVTVATITAAQLRKLPAEHFGQADIVLVVDADLPGSY
ncbi:MAG: ChaN family lipoprotein [Flavobacteriales bacterium]|nr:ChaN family lipoprotein [Flavobacteriales bacterium]